MWEEFQPSKEDDTPLVEGGQGRTGKEIASNAVTLGVSLVGLALFLAWAVWIVM